MKIFLLLAALLFASAARADQIDYVLKFADAATALRAAEIGGFLDAPTQTWTGASVIAPVRVWRTTAITPDLVNGGVTETRVVQAGFWMLVSTDGRNATIEGCACLMLEADRSLAAAGAPASSWIIANNTGITAAALGQATLPTWHIEPMFAGSQAAYHLGGGK